MTNNTYKLIEVTGSSTESSDQAIRNAISKVGQTVQHMDWFEVLNTRGHIQDGAIAHFQVTLKIGFRVE